MGWLLGQNRKARQEASEIGKKPLKPDRCGDERRASPRCESTGGGGGAPPQLDNANPARQVVRSSFVGRGACPGPPGSAVTWFTWRCRAGTPGVTSFVMRRFPCTTSTRWRRASSHSLTLRGTICNSSTGLVGVLPKAAVRRDPSEPRARAALWTTRVAAVPNAVVVSSIRGFEHKYERLDELDGPRTVAVSEGVRSYLIANGIAGGKIVTIPERCGCRGGPNRDGHDRHYLHRELGLEPAVRLVGMVAFFRANTLKGHKVFLDAAPLVSRAEPDVHFILVGSNLSATGPYKEHFEQYVDGARHRKGRPLSGRADRHVPDHAIAVRARAAVVPRRMPDGGARGDGVRDADRSSRIEAISEIIEDGRSGILVEPGDHEALAGEIVGLLRDPAKAGGDRRGGTPARRRSVSRPNR